MVPDQMRLRIAVQQQDGRPLAADTGVDPDAVGVHGPPGERGGQQITHGAITAAPAWRVQDRLTTMHIGMSYQRPVTVPSQCPVGVPEKRSISVPGGRAVDVRQLEYFLAVVDHGGFNRAATALHLSQPSLSQSVRALERDLGSDLFHRIGRRAVLTEAGTALIEPARTAVRSLQLARASVESVHGLRTGRVDVASSPSQAIEPLTGLIHRFARAHPAVSVVVQAAFTPRDVTDMVRTGVSELGLVATPGPLPEGEVRSYPLTEQRFVLLTPPDGPFPPGSVVQHEQLAGQRLIVGQRGSGMRAYVDGLRAAGVDLTFVVETEHRIAILPLVLSGVGMAVVADAWRGFAEQAGARVLDIEPATGLRIALVSRRTALTPAARAFLECATARRTAPTAPGTDSEPL